MRNAYWDTVLVSDGEIDARTLYDWRDRLNVCLKSAFVEGAPESESCFLASDDSFEISKEIFDVLCNLGIIPDFGCSNINTIAKLHVMGVGGKMARHDDYSYSLAVTIYLSSCVGGELKVYSRYDQDILISPVFGRLVLLKCQNDHEVLEVKGGCRESIQLFIRVEDETRS